MADRFVSNTGAIAVGQAAVKLSQVVLAMALVRMLDPDQWNQAAFVLSVYLAATTLGTFGIHHALLYHLPRVDPGQQRDLVTRAVSMLVAIGAATVVAFAVVGPGVAGHQLAGAGRWALLGLAVAVELPSACFTTALIATRRFLAAGAWDVCGTLVTIGAVLTPVFDGRGVAGVIAGLTIAGGCRLLIGGRCVLGACSPSTARVTSAIAAELVRYGVPLGLLVSVSIVNRIVDKWLIAAFRPSDFGLYSIAAQEVPLLVVLPYVGGAALASSLVCAFRDGDLAAARTHWLHLTSRMSRIVVPLSVGLALIGGPVMNVLFTSRFDRAVLPFQVFTLIGVHRVAEYGLMLRAAGRNRALIEVAVTTLLANVVLAGVGAHLGGMTGASVGTAVATFVGWWLALRNIAGSLGVGVAEAFAWKTWLATVAVAASAAITTQLVTAPLDAGPLIVIAVRASVFAAIYTVVWSAWRRSRHSSDPQARWIPERPVALEVVAS